MTGFHSHEFVGAATSARKSLESHVLSFAQFRACHVINAQSDSLDEECARLDKLIASNPIDVCLVTVSETGGLALNEPPANVDETKAFVVVNLAESNFAGSFGKITREALAKEHAIEGGGAAVPEKAISVSVKQILKATKVVCVVPDKVAGTSSWFV